MSSIAIDDLRVRLDQRRGACALIAIKERARCKERLSDVLAPLERIQLARSMLAAVLSAARGAQTVRQVVVVSPERDFVPAEVPVLADTGACLNSALTQAQITLGESGCREVAILVADLPDITADDIDGLIHAGRLGGFAIAPDTTQTGTNALYLRLPHSFRFQFGPDSKRLHLQEAGRMGLRPQVVQLAGLQFDVDLPGDLHRLGEERWLASFQA
jgi:2-phospho-L-lactate guanylyltransferase